MTLNILQEMDNKLFNRKEIIATIDAQVTPSHEEVEKYLSEKFKTNPENIKIKKIEGKFGSKTFTILANIYSSKQEKDAIELKKKREIEKDKKAAEPKPEEKPVEEQAEPVKEEPKEEKSTTDADDKKVNDNSDKQSEQLTDKDQSSEASENKEKKE